MKADSFSCNANPFAVQLAMDPPFATITFEVYDPVGYSLTSVKLVSEKVSRYNGTKSNTLR